jgi:hypothetical protein
VCAVYRRSFARKLAAACIVIAGFLLIATSYGLGMQGNNPASSDFIGYWVAGQQLAHHSNPYDERAIFQLEKSVGYDGNEPRLTPSPPIALVVLLPLGWLGLKAGLFLWTITQFACLALALRILWFAHCRPPTQLYLFGFVFAPAIACLQAGQLGIFLLLSVALFLYFLQTRPFLAGAVLLPCALKPHLFVPLAVVFLLWSASNKAYRAALGCASAMLVSSLLTLLFDPGVWAHFSAMSHASSLQDRYTPTLSVVFRMLVAWNAQWPRYVLLVIGCGWALRYFWIRRERWDWVEDGQLVLLVSVLCSPYTWFTDESILLPAVLWSILRANQLHRSLLPIAFAAAVALAEIGASVKITTLFYLWTTPAWLACYLYSTRVPTKLAWNRPVPSPSSPTAATSRQ